MFPTLGRAQEPLATQEWLRRMVQLVQLFFFLGRGKGGKTSRHIEPEYQLCASLSVLHRSAGTAHNAVPEFNTSGFMNTGHSTMMAPSMYSSNHIPFAAHSKLKHCLGPTVLSEQRLSKVYRYKQKRQARSARVTTDSAAFRGRCFFFFLFVF